MKLLTFVALVAGEALVIAAELWAARYFSAARPWETLLPVSLCALAGTALLVWGYAYGYQAFGNIWIVIALTVCGMFVVEPVSAWLLFKEVPTTGAALGLALGIAGVAASLFIK